MTTRHRTALVGVASAVLGSGLSPRLRLGLPFWSVAFSNPRAIAGKTQPPIHINPSVAAAQEIESMSLPFYQVTASLFGA